MSKTKQKKVNPYAKQPEKKTNWPLIIVAAVLVAALIVAGVLLLGGKHKNTADDGLLHGTYYAQIDVKDYGTITAELYADTAPITVTNFVTLVNQGFYDGLTFHRIIPAEAMDALYADLDTYFSIIQTNTTSVLETRTLLINHLGALQALLSQ